MNVTLGESKSFEALLRGGEKLFSLTPLGREEEETDRDKETRKGSERKREREREKELKRRVERGERSARGRVRRERYETKGEEKGIGELCLQYDRGLTRAKVARVTPSSY